MQKIITTPESMFEIIRQFFVNSTQTLQISEYEFTYKPLVDMIIQASKNGVQVSVIVDRRNPHNVALRAYLKKFDGDIELRLGNHTYRIFHPKYMISDNKQAIIGSSNLTKAGMFYNREVSLLTDDPQVISQLLAVFSHDLANSELSHTFQAKLRSFFTKLEK